MSEKTIYTDSAKVDHVREFLNKNKEYRNKIRLLKGRQGGVFLFNPLEDSTITQFFNEDPEEFHFVVKAAIFLYLQAELPDSQLPAIIRNNTKIKFTEATRIPLAKLNTSYEGVPVVFDAQILGIGEMQSYTKKAQGKCPACGHTEKMSSLSQKIHCPNDDCSARNILEVQKETVVTGDIMSVMIQEPLEENLTSVPITRHCIVKDDDVYTTKPGQRKRIVGVFRSVAVPNKHMNRVEINAITLDDLAEIPEKETTEDEKLFFKSLLKKENYQNFVSMSLAPEIINEDLAKFIVMICAIGGYNIANLKILCHALIIGDPGSGKTQILEAIVRLIKKSGFMNGASMTGSTATITMDHLPNKQKFPRAGIIPLCDEGLAAIDELSVLYEKSAEDVTRIYQGMVSQYIDYNKGGFNQRLKARTTIVCGTNPKQGFYDPSRGPVDNINLPAPLLSRFDLKYNIERKKKTAAEKTAIRKHMILVREHGLDTFIEQQGLLTEEQLRRFILYCKSFKPKFSQEGEDRLEKFCAEMEEVEQPIGAIPLDNRFFESMLIISTAIARFFQSDKVTEKHINIAIDTYKKCMESLGMNTSTGVGQFSDQKLITGKKAAFEWGLKQLQAVSEDTRFTETDALQHITDKYQQYFKTEYEVQKMFDEYYEKGLITKVSGRYQINT